MINKFTGVSTLIFYRFKINCNSINCIVLMIQNKYSNFIEFYFVISVLAFVNLTQIPH
jgi:hypothetical protein